MLYKRENIPTIMAFIHHGVYISLVPSPSLTWTSSRLPISSVPNRFASRHRPKFTFLKFQPVDAVTTPIESSLQPVRYEHHITKTVMPADTDYVSIISVAEMFGNTSSFPNPFHPTDKCIAQSGAMWHGNYLKWLEEARVNYFIGRNLPYQRLMNMHRIELPVKHVSMEYLRPARLGDQVKIIIRLGEPVTKVRVTVLSEFVRVEDNEILATASVTIVPIDCDTGKIRRVWPEELTNAFFEKA